MVQALQLSGTVSTLHIYLYWVQDRHFRAGIYSCVEQYRQQLIPSPALLWHEHLHTDTFLMNCSSYLRRSGIHRSSACPVEHASHLAHESMQLTSSPPSMWMPPARIISPFNGVSFISMGFLAHRRSSNQQLMHRRKLAVQHSNSHPPSLNPHPPLLPHWQI